MIISKLKTAGTLCFLFLVVLLPLQSKAEENTICASLPGVQQCMTNCSAPFPVHLVAGDPGCVGFNMVCCGKASSGSGSLPEVKSLPKFNSLITADSNTFIANIIKGLLGLAGTLTIIMMVYGGILWMTAAGNEKAIGKAKQIMVWTTIGLVLIFSSYAILKFIFASLGATT